MLAASRNVYVLRERLISRSGMKQGKPLNRTAIRATAGKVGSHDQHLPPAIAVRKAPGCTVTSKRVTRYYCDHCRKGNLSAGAMRRHEVGCTANPNRVCGLCKNANIKQGPMADLMACLSLDKEGFGMKELRGLANECPACILAAIRQAKIQPVEDYRENGPLDYGFDFKAELASWWEEINAELEDARYYG